MKKKLTEIQAVWDDSENGWYFRAGIHHGWMPYDPPGDTDDLEMLEDEARAFADWCGLDATDATFEVIR
ncbi:MAG: hypothetical protein GY847_28775 [Proteobacteria bacterium]|nr:hypothetical protein [Pseudomonadota bacterium]